MGEIADNIQGIGPANEAKLKAAGISKLGDLREMNLNEVSGQTNLSIPRLRDWQNMALLQLIPGIDKDYAEALVKSSIPDFYALAHIETATIVAAVDKMAQDGVIPQSATELQVLEWQRYARELETEQLEGEERLAPEVAVVWEAMTCRAMRNYYEENNHACRWFHQYGPFHAYDVTAEDTLQDPEGYLNAFYVGKRYQIPELLSGCRKAPIMSIGLNPNLRAVTDKKRIYPYFDDIRQYAEHFRYRTNYKYSIDPVFYNAHGIPGTDEAAFAYDEIMPLSKRYVSMYNEYRDILQALEGKIGIAGSELSLGEDVSYYNFVACHSPRWNMGAEKEQGIVTECFRNRQYFLRQLRQSSPKVIILFGKPIMRQFVGFFRDNFSPPNIPNPNKTYPEILATNNYVMDLDGEKIRVIFSSHPTGNSAYYNNIGARDKIVEALKDEYDQDNLKYDATLKHFERTDGSCGFCNNGLFFIGECDYGK